VKAQEASSLHPYPCPALDSPPAVQDDRGSETDFPASGASACDAVVVVSWVEVFVGFVVAHLVGDYLVQTDWQARNKFRGLAGDPLARRALATHVVTYTLTFVPVLVWIGSEVSVGWAILAALLVGLPHLVIDDGRPVRAYLHRVKGVEEIDRGLAGSVDQTFHVVCLWALAMLIGAV